MKITFGTTIDIVELGETDVVVEADITPPDPGGMHYPPSGPIPEILCVTIDRGSDEPAGPDITLDIDLATLEALEERAVLTWQEDGCDEEEREPDDDDYAHYDLDLDAEEAFKALGNLDVRDDHDEEES
jgi:hypothetical protein